MKRERAESGTTGALPDILAHGLACVFCGINPGRVSSAAGAHFANPRNDFWRLLRDAGFTPRRLDPSEQSSILEYGYGLTNAAYKTTRGSADLRRGDFAGAAERLERIAAELAPYAIAFVGKEAYRGAFGERPQLGLQSRMLRETMLFVLPSTSPANAAVPYAERLRWFSELRRLLEPQDRPAVRAVVLDSSQRVLLMRFVSPGGTSFWTTPGGALEPDETYEQALRRELVEEIGLVDFEPGRPIWTRVETFAWRDRLLRQSEQFYFVQVDAHDVVPTVDLVAEDVHEHRWWSVAEIERSDAIFYPTRLAALLRDLIERGPPASPIDAGV